MSDAPERGAVISGIGISGIGRKTNRPHLDMTLESVRAAIADAGLTPADIDAVATLGDTPAAQVEQALGLRNAGIEAVQAGGLLAPVMGAFLAVTSGRARHVLVYRTVQMMGGDIPIPDGDAPAGGESPAATVGNVMGDMMPLLAYHAYSAAHWLAMHMRRHMYLYGTTKEQFGWLAVNSRRFAGLNERAVYREPITLDDYLTARPVTDPLCLLDCDVPIDGSIAVVVSVPEYAADCPHPAVRVDSFGTSAGAALGWVNRPDYPKMASIEAARELWSKTSLTPADVDVAELYDGFTFLTFAWLEALGFCGEGESGPFVEGAANIALGGRLPLNTYGGQLSAGRMHGYWVLHEACVQLRGEGGPRQVDGAEVAVVSNGGGPIAGCMLLTR
ncbi:MAG: thiolase family protein [Acidimicrobiia bacterium]